MLSIQGPTHVLDMINLVGTSTSYGQQDWLWFIVIPGTLVNCNDHHFSFLEVLLYVSGLRQLYLSGFSYMTS